MNPLSEIGIYLAQAIGSFYLLIVVARFLFQLARVDFYNPVSQFVVKATNPPLIRLRKVVPGFGGLDLSSLVLALLVSVTTILLSGLFIGALLNPLLVIAWATLGIISMISWIYYIGLFVMIILSFVAPLSRNPFAVLVQQLLYPVCRPFQRILPPMGGLDFSPILIFISINVLHILLRHFAAALALPSGIVPGFF
ncbi:MAG: YggT family protein [Pseudomonadales bacterium]|nr:YggT family protein [Pseudomonadales bacterium]